jgi:hypothetical protein
LREVLTQLANALREDWVIDERESSVDATVAAAKGGGEIVELTKRGKGGRFWRLRIGSRANLSTMSVFQLATGPSSVHCR